MKKVWAMVLALMLLCGTASAKQSKLSFEAETLLMPGLYMEMSVPAGIKEWYTQDETSLMWRAQYDEGLRYTGENEDVRISVWMYNALYDMTFNEYMEKVYDTATTGYHREEITLYGGKAYHIWRDPEPDVDGYILSNENELEGMEASLVYSIFFTTPTERGKTMRDEMLASLRAISLK
ncbi:MAG: hypothetical protein PHY12_04140 [Eubacteriales bacterium]|nr:hypothetical protein [Eubacteriales bacterium]